MTNRSRKQFDTVKSSCYSQLEARHLLSADFGVELFDTTGVSTPQSEVEFVDVQWKGQTLEAKNDEWLIWQEDVEGGRSQGFDSLKVGDANVLTVNGTEYVWAEEQKLQVTREITSGLFVLSGAANFSFERVAESVAAWMPNTVVEPNFKLTVAATPDDTDFGQLWGLNNTGQLGGVVDADIDAVEAWDVTTGSSEVVVGVIDTGIDYNHPDLINNIWTNPGEIAGNGIDDDGNGFIDDVHGWDFANNDSDPFDDQGHGTHVAGTIGAVGNNSLGVVGVSQNVSLVALKFLDASGSGTTAGAIGAIAYSNMLRESGVNLVMTNNSWGGGGFSSPLEAVIQDALSLDILFVAAAGNDGNSAIHYPAGYDVDNIISVAATDRFDQLASFSNFGPTLVDLAAPGVDILSTQPGNRYATFSGTSMASPHVAGALALLVANEPNLSALELKARLLERVDVLPQLDGIVATSGRLNVNELLDQVSAVNFTAGSFLTPGTISLELDDPTGFAADASVTITSSSGDVETLVITATGSLEFATSIESVVGAANSNDGILQVTSGDTLTATYFDFDDESGVTLTDTALIFEDDYGNDAASATSLVADLNVSGNIEVSDDEDWFSFSTQSGMEYEFRTTLESLSRSVLNLYDTDGTTLLGTGNGLVSFVAPENGTYFVSVGHPGNSFGTYDLAGTVSIPEGSVDFDAATFPVPGLVSLQLTDPTGFSAGAVVTIETSSGDIEDLVITDTGSLVAAASIDAVQGAASSNDGILQITSGDTLTATFFDDDNGFGGTFTATDTATVIGDDHGNEAATATDVDSPIDVAGELERTADADWFRFGVVPGFQYEFETTLGTLGDSFLYLYDTDGTTLLTSNDDGGVGLASLISYQFPDSGSYYLSVRAFADSGTGTYQLTGTAPQGAAVNFNSDTFATPGPVGLTVTDLSGFAPGATVAITATSGDWELITIPDTGSFSFATSVDSVVGVGSPNDGILQVFSGAVLTATYVDSDDGSGGSVTVTDTAAIEIDDHGNDAVAATVVGSPFDVSGDLERVGDADWFRFDAVPGFLYEFETTLGSLGDSFLYLYDTDGTTLLTSNDDGGVGLASRITFQFAQSGSYYLSVRAFADSGAGTYQLAGTAPPTAVVVVEDVIASGTGFSSAFIDAVDGEGVGAGNGLGYSLVGDHQLETLPWLSLDTIYLQFSDDVSASIAAGDIVLTGADGSAYDIDMVSYDTGSNTAEFRVSDGVDIDSLVISVMDGTVSNASGSLLDGEWASGQTSSSGDGNAGGQFDFFFNVLPGDEDGSGQVNTEDAFSVFASNTDVATELNYRRDIDGSGQIGAADAFAAFAQNAYGLPAAPIAPLAPAAIASLTVDDTSNLAAPVTNGSLAANDAFFAKDLSSLNVEDFEVPQTIVDGLSNVLKADYLS